MESLMKDGRVVRGFMGVSIQDVTPALAKEFDLDDARGALVGGVTPESPAEKAGLKGGDVIVEFDGKAVRDSRNLKLQVAQTSPGTTVPVKVIRDGKGKTLDLTVKELPGGEVASKSHDSQSHKSSGTLNGVAVGDIDAGMRQQFKLPADLKGAIVTDVKPDSAAYSAGLRQSDVIVEINRKPVKNAEDALQPTENAKDKRTLVRVWSKGGSRYLVVDETKAS
jgi:serine protease Do